MRSRSIYMSIFHSRGSEVQRCVSLTRVTNAAFYSIIRTVDPNVTLTSPGQAQSFPKGSQIYSTHPCFLEQLACVQSTNTCFPSASCWCPSSFSFKIFEMSECFGSSCQDDFYGRNDQRIFVEIKRGLELAGETVELYNRLFSMIFRGMCRFGLYNVCY